MPRSAAQREAHRVREIHRRERKRAEYRDAAQKAAELAEAEDDILCPAVLRCAVLASDGALIRGARINIVAPRNASKRARHADPIAACRDPLFTARAKAAARQFQLDWHDVGCGVGTGSANYMRSGSGTGDTGHDALMAQVMTRTRLEAAVTHLGALAPHVARVVVDCVPIAAWADEVAHTVPEAIGILSTALTRLATFYWPPKPAAPEHVPEILAFGPPRSHYSLATGE